MKNISRRMRGCVSLLAMVLVSLTGEESSALWGKTGELWTPQSRLPDFSFAGYQCGEVPIPTLPVMSSVRQFGAVGDGVTDDTKAFKKALASAKPGAILIPAGRYLITDILTISKPNIVLRGEGPEKSIIFIPKSLTDIKPVMTKTTGGKPTSAYSFNGGFIVLEGNLGRSAPVVITQEAKRGDSLITVANANTFSIGSWIEVSLKETEDKSLIKYLYSDDTGNIANTYDTSTELVARVIGRDPASKRIQIDRPLRFDTRLAWKPTVCIIKPTVHDSGLENFGITFPEHEYKGHFKEVGYNGIEMRNVAHCWIKRITICDADSGIFCRSIQCTLNDISLIGSKDYGLASRGHHGIDLNNTDNLVNGFDFRINYIHDFTVSSIHCSGNVVMNGKGLNLCFDHHERAPYANLFTNIDCGIGSRVWDSGGGDALGRHSGSWATFWNLRGQKPMKVPPKDWAGRYLNVIGMTNKSGVALSTDALWFEPIDPAQLVPQNIYEAQLARRKNPKSVKK